MASLWVKYRYCYSKRRTFHGRTCIDPGAAHHLSPAPADRGTRPGTIEKYLRDLRALSLWLEERRLTKELAAEWKAHLLSAGYMPVTINSMLAALNGLCRFLGLDWRIRYLKIQHRMFRDQSRELNRPEYDRLVEAARGSGKERLAVN